MSVSACPPRMLRFLRVMRFVSWFDLALGLLLALAALLDYGPPRVVWRGAGLLLFLGGYGLWSFRPVPQEKTP